MKHRRALAVIKLALIGVPLWIAVMLAGRVVVGGQDPPGPGRGQAPTTGRGAAANQGHNVTRPDLPNPFRIVENIVTMPPGRTMGSTNAINVDSKGNIWIFERCGVNSCADSNLDPILEFDPSGRFIRSFGGGQFVFPHGVIFDKDDNMWIIDAGVVENMKGNQIFKYSPTGEPLMTLGKPGVRGTTPDLFNEPSDLAIAPNGDLYIADGHINVESNRRIVHLSKDGKFIEAWGSKGTGPLQFDNPHAIALDSKGRIFVGDRTNNRIQILSLQGEFIAEWRQFGRPSGVRIHINDRPLVASVESSRAYVVLPISEAATRVAQAFRRAVVLCGGKASPF